MKLLPTITSSLGFSAELCEKIRKRIASKMDGAEEYFCIDSKPIEICRLSKGLRCKMKGTDVTNSPAFGYCDTQKIYYFGYKLHAICGLSGVIHSYDLSPANVHDIHFLKDVKFQFHDCLPESSGKLAHSQSCSI